MPNASAHAAAKAHHWKRASSPPDLAEAAPDGEAAVDDDPEEHRDEDARRTRRGVRAGSSTPASSRDALRVVAARRDPGDAGDERGDRDRVERPGGRLPQAAREPRLGPLDASSGAGAARCRGRDRGVATSGMRRTDAGLPRGRLGNARAPLQAFDTSRARMRHTLRPSPMQASDRSSDVELLEKARDASRKLHEAIGARVVGQDDVVELMLVALLARGHALLVGVPGLAKTLLVASLAEALDLSFGRVQFTPDLLPADITGTDVLQEDDDAQRQSRRVVRFLPGPIFHNLVLADEINRTPPKTQAALLQAMQERRVTVGTQTHALPDPFQVFATRNPIEQEGTYPLPEAQLDRFLLEIHVDYPSADEEREIARRTTSAQVGARAARARERRRARAAGPRAAHPGDRRGGRARRRARPRDAPERRRRRRREVREFVRFGAGPRGSQALVLAAKARAALRGEAAADVDDVRALVVPVLRHRLVLSYRAEAEGVRDVDVLERVVAVARSR